RLRQHQPRHVEILTTDALRPVHSGLVHVRHGTPPDRRLSATCSPWITVDDSEDLQTKTNLQTKTPRGKRRQRIRVPFTHRALFRMFLAILPAASGVLKTSGSDQTPRNAVV